MTGTLHLTSVNMPSSYKPKQELLDKLVGFPFTKRLTDYHCKTCGSLMLAHFYTDADDHSKGENWDIMSGTFEQADGVFEYQAHEFIADTLDGGVADVLPSIDGKELPRYALWPEDGKQVPLDWRSEDRPQVKPSPNDKLHCRCKCGGVECWIARPSDRSKDAQGALADLIVPNHIRQQRSDMSTEDKSAWWLMDDGKKFLGGFCACNSCRLDTGMEWMQWAFIPTIDISLDREGKKPFQLPFGTLKTYNSSKGVERYHCGTCGASVFFTSDERRDLVDLAVGLIDAPEGARAETWLEFWTQRLSYREDAIPRAKSLTIAMEDGLKKFGERQSK
jgi:hypothetical protein